jgi:hypothetical protein
MSKPKRPPFQSLSRQEVISLADSFKYPLSSERIETEIRQNLRSRGYLTKEEFQAVCEWKTPRSRPKVAGNSAELIAEATRIVFSTGEERLRIGLLTLLEGVSYPTSSVFLHFLHDDPYPLMDFRAVESVFGMKKPAVYTFEFWWQYVGKCRQEAARLEVDMRTLDKALWQYSKDGGV